MIPLKLSLINFCAHENSSIDFDKFSSAVIVGKINGNEHMSNGAGKSTIFNAIKYVLFGESDFPLDELVRDGAQQAEVHFEFETNNQIYKIKRSRNKKNSSTIIKLEKLIGQKWEDISSKTPSATEIELAKLLKINWKIFSNSKILAQNDLNGLPTLPAEKRKTLFRDLLDLNIYSKYESFTKKKLTDINNKINEIDIEIKTITSQVKDVSVIKLDIANLKNSINDLNSTILNKSLNLDDLNKQILNLEKQIASQKDVLLHKASLTKNLNSLNEEKHKLSLKAKQLALDIDALKNTITKSKTTVNTLSKVDKPDIAKIDAIKNEISHLKAAQISLKKDKEKIESKHLEAGSCPTCEQEITEIYLDLVEIKKQDCLTKIIKEMDDNTIKFNNLDKNLKNLESKLSEWAKAQDELKVISPKIAASSQLLITHSSSLDDINLKLTQITAQIKDITTESESLKILDQAPLISTLENIKLDKNKISTEIDYLKNNVNNMQIQIATQEHILAQSLGFLEKIKDLKDLKSKVGKNIDKYILACQAFGSSGIPAQLTNSILDDVQIRANEFLEELRPGLQLQFSISKSKKDKEEDTLDISYIIDGKPRTYSQLSGAQKVCIAVSLKLGIAAFIKAQMGSEFNLLLLDEADQALDKKSLDTYIDMIKTLSKKFKILIITHNEYVKNNFYNIIVTQDNNGVSSIQ